MMVLPWTEVSFECYEGIRILYMEKTFWCVYDRIDIHVSAWLKKNLWRRDPMCGMCDYRGQ